MALVQQVHNAVLMVRIFITRWGKMKTIRVWLGQMTFAFISRILLCRRARSQILYLSLNHKTPHSAMYRRSVCISTANIHRKCRRRKNTKYTREAGDIWWVGKGVGGDDSAPAASSSSSSSSFYSLTPSYSQGRAMINDSVCMFAWFFFSSSSLKCVVCLWEKEGRRWIVCRAAAEFDCISAMMRYQSLVFPTASKRSVIGQRERERRAHVQ